MEHVLNTLTQRLGEHLSLSNARLKCMAQLVMALLACESVMLSKLALRMRGGALRDSQYRRVQRFFW
jgi:hypothetical protein